MAQLGQSHCKCPWIFGFFAIEEDDVQPAFGARQRFQAVARGFEAAPIDQPSLGEPRPRAIEILAIEVGQRHHPARLQRAREPERRIPESAPHLEDPPGRHQQRKLRKQPSQRLSDDGKPVALVGVAAHLRLHRIGRARQPREIVVDQRIDDVHVALHAPRNLLQGHARMPVRQNDQLNPSGG